MQKSEENVNTNQQYTQDYNFNFSSQDNQASNIEIPSQTQNNVEINQTTTTNTESQYIQQPTETTTNINSYESYFQISQHIILIINIFYNHQLVLQILQQLKLIMLKFQQQK